MIYLRKFLRDHVPRKFVPSWAEKRILQVYKRAIREVEISRNKVQADAIPSKWKNEQTVTNLRRYSYAIGKVAALENVMDRLFIEYDDEGRVPEIK